MKLPNRALLSCTAARAGSERRVESGRLTAVVLIPEDVYILTRAVGYVLRDERARHGWLLKDLGARTDMSESALSRVECGRRPLTVRQLILLCDNLGTMPSVAMLRAESEAFPFGWPED